MKFSQRIKCIADDGETGHENDPIYQDVIHYLRGVSSKAHQTSGELQKMLKDFIIDLVPAFLMAVDVILVQRYK